MIFAVFVPFILGTACGYLLNELFKIAKECNEIEESLKRK